jgi:glucose/arabinose dehydrogenase
MLEHDRTLPTAGLERVAGGLSFPTSLAFAPDGTAYVAESGLPFGGAPPGGRVLELETGRVLADGLSAPVNGLVFHDGALYVSEGSPGRITRLELDGRRDTILDGLPGPGNYHTNTVAFGPDGRLYFAQGAMTNTGIVGLDAYELGWLRRLPHAHDLPGYDVVLAGADVETPDPVGGRESVRTGAFVPFGTPAQPGRRLAGRLPCTAAIMRCDPDGGGLELVAWGVRNAYGLGFSADGSLLAVDQGADDRGSRPVGEAPDLLFEVRPGAWYGWPDFIDGEPIGAERYRPARGPRPVPVLANHDELPPPERALLRFPAHSAPVKFAVAPVDATAPAGQIVIAMFGDERPLTAPDGARAGRAVMRIDPRDWSLHPAFDMPASRPIDVAFDPCDGALHVLDFGRFEIDPAGGLIAEAGSGGVWRIPVVTG